MKKLNKFEKRFVIIDLISTGATFGGAFIILINKPNLVGWVTAAIAMSFYYFILRKSIWNALEEKEQQEIFKLPKDWKGDISLFDFFKVKKTKKDKTKNDYSVI